MNLDNWQDRYDLVSELNGRCASLISSYDLDVNDWGLLKFYMSNLFTLLEIMDAEGRFRVALEEMHALKTSDEDDRLIFPLEKALHNFIEDRLLSWLGAFTVSWNFEDYRLRSLHSEVWQKMEMLRDWYMNEYGLEEHDDYK